MKIGVIGCGNIGMAIAKCMDGAGHHLFLYDKYPLKTVYGTLCHSLEEVSHHAEWLILAIKPQQLPEVAAALAPHLRSSHIAVSTLVGVTQKQLQQLLPGPRWMRIMPNLAIRYGKGIVGICGEPQDKDALFEPLGRLIRLDESRFDALSALTASGPAFALLLVEAIAESAIQLGFNAQDSLSLSSEMLVGTLELLQDSGDHPAKLRWQIASPGGTTIAGLQAMEEKGVRAALAAAFTAAYRRAKELSCEIS